jgi:hypothetical protein
VTGKPLLDRLAVLRAHRWSSYPGYSGQGARFELVCEGPMLVLVARVCGVGVAELSAHRGSGWVKGLAGLMLVKYANLTQREAAGRLGLATGAGVSYQIRKLHRQMASHANLRQQVAKATKVLESSRA